MQQLARNPKLYRKHDSTASDGSRRKPAVFEHPRVETRKALRGCFPEFEFTVNKT